MRIIKVLIALLFIVLLVSCENNNQKIIKEKYIKQNEELYSIEYLPELSELIIGYDYDIHEVYKNKLSMIDNDINDFFTYTEHLYLFDLETHHIHEVTDIDFKGKRIWSFIELDNDEYLYVELLAPNNEYGLINFNIKYQTKSEIYTIREGYINNVLLLPEFMINNNDIYFKYSSMENSSFGNYTIEVIKYNNDTFSSIFKEVGRYDNFYLDDDCNHFTDNQIHFTNDVKMFITYSSDATNICANYINNDGVISKKIPFEKGYASITPVGDKLIVTEWERVDGEDRLYSFIVNDKMYKNVLDYAYHYYRSCTLGDKTIALPESALVKIYLNNSNDELYSYALGELHAYRFYRKIDDNSVLLFDYDSYKLPLVLTLN